jgi:SdpC family antimicrobial peptide
MRTPAGRCFRCAFVITVSAMTLVQGCTQTDHIIPTTPERVSSRKLPNAISYSIGPADGDSLFRGIFFGEGSVGAVLPELNDGTSADSYAADDTQRSYVAWAKNLIVDRVNSQDPNFLARFSSALQSGNASTVSVYMDTASQMVDVAMQQLLAESQARYDAAHPPGTCGSPVLCELPNTMYSHNAHLLHNGSLSWDTGATSTYDTVIVNSGDMVQALGVWRVKDVALAYEVAAVVTVAGIINVVAAGNVNWVINVNRFINKTKGWYKSTADYIPTGGGQADLSKEYVSGVLATKFAAPSVGISGTSNIKAGVTCTWYGDATGGVTPYTYRWTQNGTYIGNGSQVTTSFSSTGTLQLQVTTATGVWRTVSKTVTVSSTGKCLL